MKKPPFLCIFSKKVAANKKYPTYLRSQLPAGHCAGSFDNLSVPRVSLELVLATPKTTNAIEARRIFFVRQSAFDRLFR
jgi:hypothetical protein